MRIFWLLATAAVVAIPASANPAKDALIEVAKCADVAAATERLACYDKAAAGAKTALTAAPVQEAAVQTEEEEEGGVLRWFGLAESKPVTKKEEFGMQPKIKEGSKEITEISSNVLEFAQNALGRSIFILDNGQVWKQIDGDVTVVRGPKNGEQISVTIEKTFMGSYSLKIEGRNGLIKVRRVK